MSDHYILDANNQPQEASLLEWAIWLTDLTRRVGYDSTDSISVSTVFLGLDYRLGPMGDPILWETLVFRLGEEQVCDRYTSHADAVAGHKRHCEKYLQSR